MVASPWKFLVGLTRRHGKERNSASIEDTSDKPVADETQEPAQLQPPAALVLSTDGGQDTADQVDADSHASDDVPNIAKVVEEPTAPDKSALEQVDDRASTTGRRQTVAVEVSATRKPRKARALRKKTAPAKIQSTPSTTSAVSNDLQDLDDEIRQLRSQLAKKLQLQNAQLRKMLERFDQ
ncbi:hypothetical protein [Rhizobium sp. LjRoot258]|uniref:hypothetical protein n=1 Tax=Rhizobium sp. LjRoot258 TaxID=3342299 RepID=UPI003ED02D7C